MRAFAKFRSQARRVFGSFLTFGFRFTCPCCGGHFREFLTFGDIPRQNAKCPGCGSLERHRLLWLYLNEKTNYFKDNLKVLDIAPARFFQEKCKKLPNLDYISADLSSALAMMKFDITNIPMPDDRFDCIICLHVLEHIQNDEKAMRELYRVLKPGGWAILQSPVNNNLEKTFEDSTVASPESRLRVFGHREHVRIYGRDYKNRLENAGFTVKPDGFVKELADKTIERYRLSKDEIIYFCTKPAARQEG